MHRRLPQINLKEARRPGSTSIEDLFREIAPRGLKNRFVSYDFAAPRRRQQSEKHPFFPLSVATPRVRRVRNQMKPASGNGDR